MDDIERAAIAAEGYDPADPAARAELDAWARRSTWPASVCSDYAEPPAKDGR
jgi:hypothetical protein